MVNRVLLVYHIFFLASGIVMTAIGVSKKSYYSDFDFCLDNRFFVLPNLIIATGCLIFLVFVFSLWCSIDEADSISDKPCSCVSTIVLTVAVCILEISAGIAALVLRDKIVPFLRDELHQSMKNYQFISNDPNPTTIFWDRIQGQFECCGTNGPIDWSQISYQQPTTFGNSSNINPGNSDSFTVSTYISHSNDLPLSCCNQQSIGTHCQLINGSYFKRGCVDAFGDDLKNQTLTIGLVGMVMFFLQLGGFCLLLQLIFRHKEGYDML